MFHRNIKLLSLVINVALFFYFSGCALVPIKKEVDITSIEKNEPVGIDPQEDQLQKEGSLWQCNGPLSELFINTKARRVGDIVTVKIVESSSATNKATTKTGRSSSLTGSIDGLFNMEKRYPSSHPFFNPFSQIKGDLETDFDGSGTTHRSGDLSAYITTKVTDILPNGNMKILGNREVTVNNEKQFIELSGIVRQADISPDNIIFSTFISDAKIKYKGAGVINNNQNPGWLTKIINVIWPF